MKLAIVLTACAMALGLTLAGCNTPPKQFSYGTCTVSVVRVDAMGVSHTDCIYQTIP